MNSAAHSLHVLEQVAPVARPATVLAFPQAPRRNTLRPLDRIETLRWALIAQSRGLSRVDICDDDEDPEIGHFVLVYEDGREWASWGVSRENHSYCVWRTGAAGEIGQFETMRDALDVILAQPRRRPRKLPFQ